jgi:hypothetical protein
MSYPLPWNDMSQVTQTPPEILARLRMGPQNPEMGQSLPPLNIQRVWHEPDDRQGESYEKRSSHALNRGESTYRLAPQRGVAGSCH